jgi:acetyl esterase/lipase
MKRQASASLAFVLSYVALVGASAANASPSPSPPKINATPFLGDHYPPRRTLFADGVIGFADVTYETVPGFRPMTLDVYIGPHTPSSVMPLVLYIHGGGWAMGHSRQSGAFDDWPGVLASLAARGYAVASLNYRLSGEAPFPAALQDVKASIRFLRAHAADYGIDPARALVWGGSAGGHLAALAATTCGVPVLEPAPATISTPESDTLARQSDCVQGAVTWYGIFDLSTMRDATTVHGSTPPAIGRFIGCTKTPCSPESLQAASAEHYIKADLPPFLMIHGASDKTVDPTQSMHFNEAMKAAGAHAELIIIPAVDHSFLGATPEATRDASLLALNRTFAFIDATLKH